MIIYAKEDNLKELTATGFSVVDFYSETCGPCKILASLMERVNTELPFVNFIKVNTTQYPGYSAEYEIDAVPTILFVSEGELKKRTIGLMDEGELKETIAKYLYE